MSQDYSCPDCGRSTHRDGSHLDTGDHQCDPVDLIDIIHALRAQPQPAAVTEAMVSAALRAETLAIQATERWNRECDKPYADDSDDRERMHAALVAALAVVGKQTGERT